MKRIDEIVQYLEQGLLSTELDGNRSMVVANTIVESIIDALKQSSAIPWPEESAWSKAPLGTFARAVDNDGRCFFYQMHMSPNTHYCQPIQCGSIKDMTGIDWKQTFEYHPSLKSELV